MTNPAVGSGVLLDGSNVRLATIKERNGSGKASVDEQHVRALQCGWWIQARPTYPNCALRSAPSHAPGDLRQEAPYHESLVCNTGALSSLETWQGVKCRTGAETSNVKDEPRPQRARLVLQKVFRYDASFRKCLREHEA